MGLVKIMFKFQSVNKYRIVLTGKMFLGALIMYFVKIKYQVS